jgi:glycosyltransferase involved in cell wall biosynthesis
VDLKAFYPESEKGGNPGSRNGILECLFVGQISHRKGVRILLEAARRCRRLPVRFRLIGPIVSPEVLAELPENVTFEGAMAPGEVGEAMRRADMFVLPTLEDSFALVVFEAMASGLPVVTTSHAGSSETISEGIDGFVVPPCDAGALADAVAHLVEDSSLRDRMGLAARAKVVSSYSWETYGREVLNRINAVKAGNASDICSV